MIIILSFFGTALEICLAWDGYVQRISTLGVCVHHAREPAGAGRAPLVNWVAGLCAPQYSTSPTILKKNLVLIGVNFGLKNSYKQNI